MVKFVVVRHGESLYNIEKRYAGQYDTPLSPLGRKQAECTASFILANYKIDKVVASDLSRAYDTVKPVADALGLKAEACSELREVDVGSWVHVLYSEIWNADPEGRAKHLSMPAGERIFGGAECYADVKRRVVGKLRAVAEENDGKTILVGAHAGAVRVFLTECMGLDINDIDKVPKITNASVSVVTYENGVFTLKEADCKEHLILAGLAE